MEFTNEELDVLRNAVTAYIGRNPELPPDDIKALEAADRKLAELLAMKRYEPAVGYVMPGAPPGTPLKFAVHDKWLRAIVIGRDKVNVELHRVEDDDGNVWTVHWAYTQRVSG
jgi:hypothetical protein